jgi:hypothetical protein
MIRDADATRVPADTMQANSSVAVSTSLGCCAQSGDRGDIETRGSGVRAPGARSSSRDAPSALWLPISSGEALGTSCIDPKVDYGWIFANPGAESI